MTHCVLLLRPQNNFLSKLKEAFTNFADSQPTDVKKQCLCKTMNYSGWQTKSSYSTKWFWMILKTVDQYLYQDNVIDGIATQTFFVFEHQRVVLRLTRKNWGSRPVTPLLQCETSAERAVQDNTAIQCSNTVRQCSNTARQYSAPLFVWPQCNTH